MFVVKHQIIVCFFSENRRQFKRQLGSQDFDDQIAVESHSGTAVKVICFMEFILKGTTDNQPVDCTIFVGSPFIKPSNSPFTYITYDLIF